MPFVLLGFFLCLLPYDSFADTLLTPLQRKCELEALNVATRLADHYNKYDEDTEWDARLHSGYLVEYLGFADWIQIGVWKNTELTAEHENTKQLHQVCCTQYPILHITVSVPVHAKVTTFYFLITFFIERRMDWKQKYIRLCLLALAK
jgi:hypothetical protein